jgi:ribonuclease P protein subunit POP4
MYVKSLVTQILSESNKKASHFDERVKDKVLTLDNPVPLEKKDQFKKKRKRSILSMKEKKQMGLFESPKKCKYQDLLPLHELWKGYMNELSHELPQLLKADYHGCCIKGHSSLIHDD